MSSTHLRLGLPSGRFPYAEYIVTSRVTYKTGSGLDDWIH
jgi:hypothetical protein